LLTVSLYLRDLTEQAYRNTLKTTPDITWIEYKAIMLKVYKQTNTQASVFQQLENLKHTNNIRVYTEKFLYLINQAEAALEIQVYFYCKNLSTNVKKEIIYRKPETLTSAIELAKAYVSSHDEEININNINASKWCDIHHSKSHSTAECSKNSAATASFTNKRHVEPRNHTTNYNKNTNKSYPHGFKSQEKQYNRDYSCYRNNYNSNARYQQDNKNRDQLRSSSNKTGMRSEGAAQNTNNNNYGRNQPSSNSTNYQSNRNKIHVNASNTQTEDNYDTQSTSNQLQAYSPQNNNRSLGNSMIEIYFGKCSLLFNSKFPFRILCQ
jgi:hypothetical protein